MASGYKVVNGRLIDKVTGEVSCFDPSAPVGAPYVVGDLPPYKSPLGTGVIDGRRARREDLARSGCREVDPSEHKVEWRNEAWARKRGLLRG